MIRSFLIGLVAGMRALTPLAAVTDSARFSRLPRDNGAPALLVSPAVRIITLALAAGELFGDKLASAPDRIVAPGMAARIMTGALAGMALAPRRQRSAAALLGAAAAVGAAYLTFDIRVRAMRRFGQVPTGLVEDAITMASAFWIVNRMKQAR